MTVRRTLKLQVTCCIGTTWALGFLRSKKKKSSVSIWLYPSTAGCLRFSKENSWSLPRTSQGLASAFFEWLKSKKLQKFCEVYNFWRVCIAVVPSFFFNLWDVCKKNTVYASIWNVLFLTVSSARRKLSPLAYQQLQNQL